VDAVVMLAAVLALAAMIIAIPRDREPAELIF